MRTCIIYLIFIQIFLYGQSVWSPPEIVNGLTVNQNDIFVSYSNNIGIHLLINSSGTIRYVLLNKTGGEVLYEREIDNNCEYSDYTIALAAYQNELYAVYQKGTQIKVSKSIDAGNQWNLLTEKEMNSSNCNGIDVVYDELGLHVVWAVNSQIYYERYRRNDPAWVEIKHITDEGSGDEGIRPTIALSENRIHIGVLSPFNSPAPASRTRDFNFNTNEWENSQFAYYETPPLPTTEPGWVVTDFYPWIGERVTVHNNYLHNIEYLKVVVEYDPVTIEVFVYLYDKKRPVNGGEWETELLTKYVWWLIYLPPYNLMARPIAIDLNGKLHTLIEEFDTEPPYSRILTYYNFLENNWNGPTIILEESEAMYWDLTGNDGGIFAYWITSSNELLYSYAVQNPATPITLSPINKFLSKEHSFFEFTPEILLYSQKRNIDNQ